MIFNNLLKRIIKSEDPEESYNFDPEDSDEYEFTEQDSDVYRAFLKLFREQDLDEVEKWGRKNWGALGETLELCEERNKEVNCFYGSVRANMVTILKLDDLIQNQLGRAVYDYFQDVEPDELVPDDIMIIDYSHFPSSVIDLSEGIVCFIEDFKPLVYNDMELKPRRNYDKM